MNHRCEYEWDPVTGKTWPTNEENGLSSAWRGTRIVKKTQINLSEISTIFLVLDHGYGDRPLLFETRIFGGELGGYQERYWTYEEAVIGHEAACKMVKENK